MMKILVAGGAGYLGSALCPVLHDHGYQVEVVDTLWFGNALPPEIRVRKKDILDLGPGDLEGFEQVIFLAGLSNDPMAEFSPAKNFVDNGAVPSYLAFIARQAGVKRFIYASSCSVYGYTVNQLYNEESPVTCDYPYGISKLQGERGVMQLHDDRFSVISLRQGTVSGHSPRMRFDLIINTMFKCAMTDGVITVNNPSIWRPLYDIRDAVSAFLRAIQADYSISGVFNVAAGNFTVGQVGDLVKEEVEALSGRRIKILLKNVKDFRNYKVDTEKARTYLGFLPKYTITDTVRELYKHRDRYGDYSDDRFYNIRVFKKMSARELQA